MPAHSQPPSSGVRPGADSDRRDSDIPTAETVVRDFYDRHPYPPPLTSLEEYEKRWDEPGRRRADHHLLWPARPYRTDLRILIAGCGTSQAARYALRYPDAQVTGIDVSTTSIEHTDALKQTHRLSNLDLHLLPVERAASLGRVFDHVVCTGVLHHLPDPDVGLQALRSVMPPDGALLLMVYAPYGRVGIYMIQDYARRLGIGVSDGEIRDLVAVLRELPAGHPLEFLLSSAPDFRRKAALADALLNPLDCAYSVPDLFALLEDNGMRFGRWVRQAPYLPQCGSPADSPHAARLNALPASDQYAAMELFRGTMVRHSMIVYRDDAAIAQPDVEQLDLWSDFVPLRLPHTRGVTDNLPAGAAAVLLNQSHTYPDLYLPVRTQEKLWYDGIDGLRSIAEIVESCSGANKADKTTRTQACRFFSHLWQYDQIVVDMSGTGL